MVFEYRTYIELSRATHSREQVKALDKHLARHPKTKHHYTGLSGRRFCFGFDNEAALKAFKTQAEEMLRNLYTVRNNP